MSDQVSVRLAVVGGNQFRQELRQSASEGTRALQGLNTAARGVSPAFQAVGIQASQMFGTFAGGSGAAASLAGALAQAAMSGGAFGLAVGAVVTVFGSMVPLLAEGGTNARDMAREMGNLQGSTGAVNGAVSALEKVQRDYNSAISAQGGASNAAAQAVIANSKAEFEARKQVLQVELDLLRFRQSEQAAKLQLLSDTFRSDADAALERGRNFSANLADSAAEAAYTVAGVQRPRTPVQKEFEDFIASQGETRLQMQRMRAEATLTDLVIKQTEDALKTTFADIAAGGTGGTADSPNDGKAAGGGGGGGISAAEKMAAEAKKIFDSTRTAAERYATEMAKLNELLRQGAIDQETYSRAAAQLKAELESSEKFASGVAGQVKSSMSALFDSIVDGGKNAGQVIEGLGKKLLAMSLQESVFRLLAQLMPGTFGAGGFVPLVGNATGNAFGGGKVIPFARGGVVSGPTLFPMRGATGLMGEAGPEAIMPLTRVGGKLGVAAVGGGGAQVQVNINNNSGGEVTSKESRGPNGQRVLDVEIGRSIGSGRQDAVLRRFGNRPAPVKR